MAFGDGGGEVAFAVVTHRNRELCVEMIRFEGENSLELRQRGVEIAGTVIEHGVVVLILMRHKVLTKHGIARMFPRNRMSSKSKPQTPKSTASIQLISTDFDGTLFAEFENPPVPHRLQELIAECQGAGAKWVIKPVAIYPD